MIRRCGSSAALALSCATVALVTLLATSSRVAASTTSHWTSGTGGEHQGGSHYRNPSHIWVAIAATHSAGISSGGTFHDKTLGGACCIAPNGGDFAIDIGNPGSSSWPAKLYIDYGGWGAGGSPTINNNSSISFSAKALAVSGSGACQKQQYEVRASYWRTDGSYISNAIVGDLWVIHLDNWVYGTNAIVYPNSSYQNPYGTGTVSRINAIQIGRLHDGPYDGVCSTGRHSHMEFYSRHAYGLQYEWRNPNGPDYYLPNGHTHYGGYSTTDSVSTGTKVAFLGGASTSYFLYDNPQSGDH